MISKILLFVIPVFVASVAQIFFKKGVSSLGNLSFSFSGIIGLILRILHSGWLLAGIGLFGIGFLLYLFTLSKIQLNMAYTIFVSSVMIVITFASWFFLKETLSWLQILGVILIISGIFLLATKG